MTQICRTIATRSGLALALLVAVAGCGSTDAAGPSSSAANSSASSSATLSGSITVLAAASLTESFQTLGAQFEQEHPGTTITFSFAGSSALATQIDNGVPADVFASASTKNMDSVVSAGKASDPQVFTHNSLEIAVPPANPAGVTGVQDLAKPNVTVAVCQAAVPCGASAQSLFSKAGITVKPVTEEADVKSTLAKVTLGEVDAGLVYVTDVKAAGDKVKGIEIPAADNVSTDYPIATLTESANADLATAFVDYVRSANGQKVLTAAGFSSGS